MSLILASSSVKLVSQTAHSFAQRIYKFLAKSTFESHQQIAIFATISIICHFGFYFFNKNIHSGICENFYFRLSAIIVCIPLIYITKWPRLLQPLQPIYWYLSLIYLVPFFFTYMLLSNGGDLLWQFKCIIAVMYLILLIDSLSAILILMIGIVLAYLAFLHSEYYGEIEVSLLPIFSSIAPIIFLSIFYYRTKAVLTKEKQGLLQKIKEANDNIDQKVKQRTAELEESVSANHTFLNTVSHEIRTPMHGICGISEFLNEHWDRLSDLERKKQIHSIAVNSKRLKNFTDTLLDLSKFNAGKMIFEFISTDLLELTKEIIDQCENLYLFNKPNLKITLEAKGITQALIHADPFRISQLLINLFTNAIKYTSHGTITARITLVAHNNKPAWQFDLIDEGMGIPQNELEVIFDSFTRSSNNHGIGTGLGLAICKEVVVAHLGELWAENNVGKGATLSFIIPALEDFNPFLISDEDMTDINRDNAETILFVDDEKYCHDIVKLIVDHLTNYKIINAHNGMEAIHLAQKHRAEIGIIFLDMMMPDLRGDEVFYLLRKEKDLADIPVVFQSGVTENNCEIKKLLEQKNVYILPKPYEKIKFIQMINKLIVKR